MKWAVDKIINGIATIENIDTLEKKEISIKLLPTSTTEGTILRYENGKYIQDSFFEEKRKLNIEERFKRLRNNN